MLSSYLGRLRQPSNMLLAALLTAGLVAIAGLAVSRFVISNAVATSLPKETASLDNINPSSFSPETRKSLLNLEVNAGILAARLDEGTTNMALALDKSAALIADTSQIGPDAPAPLRTLLSDTAKAVRTKVNAGKTEEAARDLRALQTMLQGLRMQ
ncbi:hypothetical protein [Novosphingobium mangrovi (ex Huang et al. 2023)]|uniref:Uncharacterized protein n=1 Tax=Novosphingobium mangrovi (ex Huang et al. 2023) TaxID=2976432 RepID=A0ABT2I8K7_9SPHN|nr:hypothetical protein [Novosphingobium mangrovi (ex Huang et al. 2023)]MCT2401123.1 hypothetical protein [Novosphingobium mangrovi (ex Huang et al. 2023)]